MDRISEAANACALHVIPGDCDVSVMGRDDLARCFERILRERLWLKWTPKPEGVGPCLGRYDDVVATYRVFVDKDIPDRLSVSVVGDDGYWTCGCDLDYIPRSVNEWLGPLDGLLPPPAPEKP